MHYQLTLLLDAIIVNYLIEIQRSCFLIAALAKATEAGSLIFKLFFLTPITNASTL